MAPLPQRMRPATLDEFVGQQQVVGPDSALRRAIAADRVGSMIFYGPPGTGKTTLARIVAHTTQAHFEELSAVQVGIGDVRRVIAEADRPAGRRAARRRSSSSTRSTASTRRSRTRCCRPSSRG